jgi:hypothetical protein
MRQPVIEDGMLDKAPFAEHDISRRDGLSEPCMVGFNPCLEQAELPVSCTALQEMSA